jgi:hypothetical protein
MKHSYKNLITQLQLLDKHMSLPVVALTTPYHPNFASSQPPTESPPMPFVIETLTKLTITLRQQSYLSPISK